MLTVRSLRSDDASALSRLLAAQRPAYLKYFRPFAFDAATLGDILTASTLDVYLGLYWGDELAAFCMLRGWDEGYEVPAYGVVVAEGFQGNGLGALTLDLAEVICRLRGSSRLMLKVHPENAIAKALYLRAGFRETGVDPRTGDLVMHLDLSAAAGTRPHS